MYVHVYECKRIFAYVYVYIYICTYIGFSSWMYAFLNKVKRQCIAVCFNVLQYLALCCSKYTFHSSSRMDVLVAQGCV